MTELAQKYLNYLQELEAEHDSNIYIRDGQVQLESQSNANRYTNVGSGHLYIASNSVRMSLFEVSDVLRLILKGLPTTAPASSGAVLKIVP